MNAAHNKQLLQRIFADLSSGDSRLLVESMAEDFRWHVIGSTSWSRTYEGKPDVLTGLFGKMRPLFADRIKVRAHHFIAEDDFVVVEARGDNVTKAGAAYCNTYCFVFRLADGKLQEVTEYLDTELVTAVLGGEDGLD
jgi:ketosteroid isomerase-like protein